MSNFELQEKTVKATTRFIVRKGYELFGTGWTSPEGTQIDLVASDEDTLVFIDVTATEYGEGGIEGGKVKRGDLGIAVASWLAVNSPDGEIQDVLLEDTCRTLARASTRSAARTGDVITDGPDGSAYARDTAWSATCRGRAVARTTRHARASSPASRTSSFTIGTGMALPWTRSWNC